VLAAARVVPRRRVLPFATGLGGRATGEIVGFLLRDCHHRHSIDAFRKARRRLAGVVGEVPIQPMMPCAVLVLIVGP
jgi:hypothetical protein